MQRVHIRIVRWRSRSAGSITSSGGPEAAKPSSTTSWRYVKPTTTKSTKAAGTSRSTRNGPSAGGNPTERSGKPSTNQTDNPNGDDRGRDRPTHHQVNHQVNHPIEPPKDSNPNPASCSQEPPDSTVGVPVGASMFIGRPPVGARVSCAAARCVVLMSVFVPVVSCRWCRAGGVVPVVSCRWCRAGGVVPVVSCRWCRAGGVVPVVSCAVVSCRWCRAGGVVPVVWRCSCWRCSCWRCRARVNDSCRRRRARRRRGVRGRTPGGFPRRQRSRSIGQRWCTGPRRRSRHPAQRPERRRPLDRALYLTPPISQIEVVWPQSQSITQLDDSSSIAAAVEDDTNRRIQRWVLLIAGT